MPLRARDRGQEPRPEPAVAAEDRPVEVAGERRDVAGEAVRENQPLVESTTYWATSAICCGSSWSENEGIPPWPSVMRVTASS